MGEDSLFMGYGPPPSPPHVGQPWSEVMTGSYRIIQSMQFLPRVSQFEAVWNICGTVTLSKSYRKQVSVLHWASSW